MGNITWQVWIWKLFCTSSKAIRFIWKICSEHFNQHVQCHVYCVYICNYARRIHWKHRRSGAWQLIKSLLSSIYPLYFFNYIHDYNSKGHKHAPFFSYRCEEGCETETPNYRSWMWAHKKAKQLPGGKLTKQTNALYKHQFTKRTTEERSPSTDGLE